MYKYESNYESEDFKEISKSLYDSMTRTLTKLYLDRDRMATISLVSLLKEFASFSEPLYVKGKYGSAPAKRFLELVKTLQENADRLELKEYVCFLKVFSGYIHWIARDFNRNTLLVCVSRMMTDTGTLLDFVRFVSEVVLEYEGELPIGDDWIDEILKNDGSFGMSSALLIPLMLDGDDTIDNVGEPRNRVSIRTSDQNHFRQWLADI